MTVTHPDRLRLTSVFANQIHEDHAKTIEALKQIGEDETMDYLHRVVALEMMVSELANIQMNIALMMDARNRQVEQIMSDQ